MGQTGRVAASTIPELLAGAAERDPDGEWVRTDDGTLSFGAAAARVAALADRFADAGVRAGDLVALTARTTPEYLLAWLALGSLGAVSVPTDPAASSAERAGLLGQVRPTHVVTDALLRADVEAAVASSSPSSVVLDVDTLVGDWAAGAVPSGGSLRTTVTGDDLVVLIPTSGTTGRSKLVMQTHRAYAWAGEGFPYWMRLDASDRLMTSLPLFHINAPAYSVCGSLAVGAGLVLLPRFSVSGFLDAARRHGATEFNAIGAMLEFLMAQPERPDDASSPLRRCYTGPSPKREWQEAFEERFGLEVVCGYAMSESPYGLIWAHGTRPFETLGQVRQHPTLGVVNSARVVSSSGDAVPPGGTGEMLLRNPVLAKGYWQMPSETAAAFVDGWLHTGDLVTDNGDGTYTFVARVKEVLRRRGNNLSPAEVEDAVASHPSVREVAVVGVPSEHTEEEVKAFVVAASGVLDLPALRAHAAERLTAFKVPRFWEQVEELPRTPTARVAKHRLPKERTAAEWDAEAPG
jgi:crotonobetaine/carnitine-CoA ligase